MNLIEELLYQDESSIYYRNDCQRIRKIARELGYEISMLQAQQLWKNYSATYSAGWLELPPDDELKEILSN